MYIAPFNSRAPLSKDVMENEVRRVFLDALGWTEDAYERDMNGKSEKFCRKTPELWNKREALGLVEQQRGDPMIHTHTIPQPAYSAR